MGRYKVTQTLDLRSASGIYVSWGGMTTTINEPQHDVTNPVTGEVIDSVRIYDEADTVAAIERARSAQKQWAETSMKERRKIMLRYHDLVLEKQAEVLDQLQAETGKNRASAFAEVLDSALASRHYGYGAKELLKTKRVRGAFPLVTKTEVERDPIGVVGIINPWNYPLALSIADAIPALMAGNAVVLKPDLQTPLTPLLGAELMYEAGLPREVLQILPGKGTEVGQGIVKNADYVMFTGSTETGKKLAAQAAERLVGFSGELGGKNPLIITHDAKPSDIVDSVREACFANSGQLCISIERMYVHRDVADQFIPAFRSAVEAMQIAGDNDWQTDMGSLISPEHMNKVDELVQDAVAKGAKVLTGGKPLPELGPAFYAPTVLSDVPEDADFYRQEAFGPVVFIEVVDSDEEAVRRANDTEYGLNASVFGKESTARKLASQLEAGTVNINEGWAAGWSSFDAPMGGWKQSGMGRRHGEQGLLKYTEPRTVAAQRVIPLSRPFLDDGAQWAGLLTLALKSARDLLR